MRQLQLPLLGVLKRHSQKQKGEGDMRDAITKIRILFGFLSSSVDAWKSEVWSRDLDERYCCDGRECGCQGVSVREVYSPAPKEEGK